MTTVHDTTAKFQFIDPPPLPAWCVSCRKDADGKTRFVDLTADIDYYGAILLCENCASEVAGVVGFGDISVLASFDNEKSSLIEENSELLAKIEALEHVITEYFIDLTGHARTSVPDVVNFSVETPAVSSDKSDEGTGKTKKSESGPTKSVTKF